MLDMDVSYLHHTMGDMAPTSLLVLALALVLAICTTSVESNPSPPRSFASRGLASDSHRITDLQLLHPMPVLPPLDQGSPDETFSNIPSSAFTLDTEGGSKRTFKKDLSGDLPSYPRGALVGRGDPLARVLLVLDPDQVDEQETEDNTDTTLEWFTPEDTPQLNDDTQTSSSPADQWNLLSKLMHNPYLNSIHYDRTRDPQQTDDRIRYELHTKQVETLDPMTPFVNRGSGPQGGGPQHTRVHPHLNTLEHYGFVKERDDPRTFYDLNKKHYDANKVHYGSDKVYNVLHKHYGSNKEHYGPHEHYGSNHADRGSNKERYDSNKQHYYSSDKVHYDANKGDTNGLTKASYDPNKEYYGLHKHYGSNKEYYGPHKHYVSNNEIMKEPFDSITETYGWNEERSLPRVNLDVSEANVALCRALYLDRVEAVPCGGQTAAGDCGQPRGPTGGRRTVPDEPWLALGGGKDQSGKPSLVV